MKITEMISRIEAIKTKSAWEHGVRDYALSLLEIYANGYNVDELPCGSELEKMLLDGSQSWKDFSYNGLAYLYDNEIAELLCNPSEYKKTDGGNKPPNRRETWLDVQARALFQAYKMIERNMK